MSVPNIVQHSNNYQVYEFIFPKFVYLISFGEKLTYINCSQCKMIIYKLQLDNASKFIIIKLVAQTCQKYSPCDYLLLFHGPYLTDNPTPAKTRCPIVTFYCL